VGDSGHGPRAQPRAGGSIPRRRVAVAVTRPVDLTGQLRSYLMRVPRARPVRRAGRRESGATGWWGRPRARRGFRLDQTSGATVLLERTGKQ
jgi:hypothetical protein